MHQHTQTSVWVSSDKAIKAMLVCASEYNTIDTANEPGGNKSP